MPASTMLGSPKFGWLKTLKNWASTLQLHPLSHRKPLGEIEVIPEEIGTAQGIAAEVSELAMLRVVAAISTARCSGSTADTKASGLSHWIVPGCVTPGIGMMRIERDAGNNTRELRSTALHNAVSVR